MSIFRPYEPDQQLLLPPSLREWLPADHLIWFISETVDQLDLTHILAHYEDRGPGNLPYHPAMMLKLLIYAYASKRKAMSYERMQQESRRLRKEIAALTEHAANLDAAEDVEFGPDFRSA